ncbi:MAG TPA: hypothetical protein PKD94_02070 [Ignavibacteria bacterium]|mgnify:CR=1 FL=1|nr:hypothetical protein [Ignavibacteria bacterium]
MNKIVSIVVLIIFALNVNSQDTNLVKRFKLNFAVPDIPAFKMLGTSPSEILKPSTPESISLIAAQFINGTNLVLPKSISVEIAPFLLFNKGLTLQQYDNNSQLYSLRLSVGTLLDSNDNTTKLSIGTRISIIDKGDLKNDRLFRDELYNLTSKIVSEKDKYQDEFLKQNHLTIQLAISDSSTHKRMEDYVKSRIQSSYDDSLESIKSHYKSINWNKQKLDVAMAVLGQSSDSLVKRLQFKSLSFWVSYSHPISSWGQLILGGNFSHFKDSSNYQEYSVGTRFYGGINRIKAFVEGQFSYSGQTKSSNALLNFGSELGVFDGIWVDLTAGIEWNNLNDDHTDAKFVSSFNMKFSLPENFHF